MHRYSPGKFHSKMLSILKVLVVLLTVSNILVGVIACYLLWGVDHRYSALMQKSVPALNDLRELMSDTVAAMRSTNPNNFSGPGAEAQAKLMLSHRRLAAVKSARADVLKDSIFSEMAASVKDINSTGAEFDNACGEFYDLQSGGHQAEAASLRYNKLLPAFDRHLAMIGAAADAVEARSLAVSKNYSGSTTSFATMILGVASWPVLVLAALFLLVLVFIIATMISTIFVEDPPELH